MEEPLLACLRQATQASGRPHRAAGLALESDEVFLDADGGLGVVAAVALDILLDEALQQLAAVVLGDWQGGHAAFVGMQHADALLQTFSHMIAAEKVQKTTFQSRLPHTASRAARVQQQAPHLSLRRSCAPLTIEVPVVLS